VILVARHCREGGDVMSDRDWPGCDDGNAWSIKRQKFDAFGACKSTQGYVALSRLRVVMDVDGLRGWGDTAQCAGARQWKERLRRSLGNWSRRERNYLRAAHERGWSERLSRGSSSLVYFRGGRRAAEWEERRVCMRQIHDANNPHAPLPPMPTPAN
jgi:hypothetical protein